METGQTPLTSAPLSQTGHNTAYAPFSDFGGPRRPGFVAVCHAPDDGGSAGVAESDAGGGDGGAAAIPARPDYVPENFWDASTGAAKLEDLSKGYAELVAFKAQQDERLKGFPDTADAYALELPADFKLPDGMQWNIPADDPLVKGFKAWAFENKVPPAQAQGLLKAHVESQLFELATAQDGIKAAHAQLGEKAGERISAVTAWAKANGAETLAAMVQTSEGHKAVAELEALIAKTSTALPGGGSDQIKISDDEYNRMSPAERLAHARRVGAKN